MIFFFKALNSLFVVGDVECEPTRVAAGSQVWNGRVRMLQLAVDRACKQVGRRRMAAAGGGGGQVEKVYLHLGHFAG